MLQSFSRSLFIFVFTCALVIPVLADESDSKYLLILNAVDQAEEFQKTGKLDAARAKYEAAEKALFEIKKADPTWKPAMVSHRLADVSAKLKALTAPAETPATTNAANVKPEEAAGKFPTGLKLLATGSEPRVQLRFKPVAGSKQSVEMATTSGVQMDIPGAGDRSMEMPAITVPVTYTVDSVADDGGFVFTVTFGEATIKGDGDVPGSAAMLKTAFGGAKGSTLSLNLNSRGIIRAPFEWPDSVPAASRSQLFKVLDAVSEFSGAFPEEHVGVGARWQIGRVVSEGGLSYNQTTTYELTALTGNRAELNITQTQDASNQKISSPALPGMKLDLNKFSGSSTGRSSVDLTLVAPISGEMKSAVEMQMSFAIGGQKQSMSVKNSGTAKVVSK